ncbi:MAG: ATP-binding protein [Agarilytica sp.]
MAFDLSSISKTSNIKPPICIFYGVAGVGKTTLLASAPNAIFIQAEDGDGILEVDAFPRVTDFNQVVSAISSLINEDHSFKWLVIDTLSALQQLVFSSVCEENKVNSIEEISYGKGYAFALAKWQLLLSLLIELRDRKGMATALIAHSDVFSFHNPEGEDYDRYNMSLDKRALKLFNERTDIIGFINYKTYIKKTDTDKKAKGVDGGRTLYLRETPAFIAKNRYKLPDELPIPDCDDPWQYFQSAFTNAINNRGKNNG